jgi:hypothetical protein
MTLRCKPGDLAVIIGYNAAYPHLTGRLVDVIQLAPVGCGFQLPDGKFHLPCSPGDWVIRFHSPVDLSGLRGKKLSFYVVCHDRALRPIRDPGEDAQDETLAWKHVPTKDEVTA